jgi:hypothetical protein
MSRRWREGLKIVAVSLAIIAVSSGIVQGIP